MRWRVYMIMVVTLVSVIACMRLSAAPALVGPPPKEISSEALVNYDVVSQTGETVGPVDGVIISTETGETLYIVVFLKDIYNFGRGATHSPQDHFLPIPWQYITPSTGTHQLIVDADTDFVHDAPVFDHAPDTSAPEWDSTVKAYWTKSR